MLWMKGLVLEGVSCTNPTQFKTRHGMQGTTERVLSLYGGKEPYTFVTSPEKQSISGVEGAGRGRGGVQVLERWGPESAENMYSPARPMVPAKVHTFQISGLGGGERCGSGRFVAMVRFGSWRFGFCGSVRFQNLTEN